MKKLSLVVTLFLFTVVSYAITPGQQLQNLLNSISSMQANFSQHLSNARGKYAKNSSGTMAIQKPGLFRWTITSPRYVNMVSNGKVIWIYDKSLQQVSISSVKKAQSSSPAVILSNRIRLLSNYFIV